MRTELWRFKVFLTFWETSTQENPTPEASDRPETRLELLTRISSIRFVVHFLISRTSEHRKSHPDISVKQHSYTCWRNEA